MTSQTPPIDNTLTALLTRPMPQLDLTVDNPQSGAAGRLQHVNDIRLFGGKWAIIDQRGALCYLERDHGLYVLPQWYTRQFRNRTDQWFKELASVKIVLDTDCALLRSMFGDCAASWFRVDVCKAAAQTVFYIGFFEDSTPYRIVDPTPESIAKTIRFYRAQFNDGRCSLVVGKYGDKLEALRVALDAVGWRYTSNAQVDNDEFAVFFGWRQQKDGTNDLLCSLKTQTAPSLTVLATQPETEEVQLFRILIGLGRRRRWPYLVNLLISIQLSLMPFDVPPYVVLEIIDWLPFYDQQTRLIKITKIEAIRDSIRRVLNRRSLDDKCTRTDQ